MVSLNLRMDTKETCAKNGQMCSEFVNLSKLNSQHNWGPVRSFEKKENLYLDNK